MRPLLSAPLRAAFLVAQLLGALLSGLAADTWEPLAVVTLLGGLGYGLALLVSKRLPVADAFWMTYSVAALAAGGAQYYSSVYFGSTISTIDARIYMSIIQRGSAEEPLESLKIIVNAPLAVAFWRRLRLVWLDWGGSFGPWLLVSFNAVAMGFSASLAVSTARRLGGHDLRPQTRASWLFALSGFTALFGGLLLRDAFLVLAFSVLFALVVWGMEFFSVRRLVLLLIGAALLFPLVYQLRTRAAMMVPALLLLAGCVALFRRRRGPWDVLAAFALGGALVAVLALSAEPMQIVGRMIATTGEIYQGYRVAGASPDSLGMRVYYSQPLVLRLLLGPILLFVAPIPLWSYFEPGAFEYNWFKGWSGFFTVVVVPMAVATSLRAFRRVRRREEGGTGTAFLAASVAILAVSVILTSMETRHLAQFLLPIVVLAALAPGPTQEGRWGYLWLTRAWWAGVVAIHVLWTILKALS